MDNNGDEGGARVPETVWEGCLAAGGLLVDVAARELPGEETLPPREDLAVVIGAAAHTQLSSRGLDDVDAVQQLVLTGPDGLGQAVDRSAYSLLQQAPAELDVAVKHRLLQDGQGDPDARRRWTRVRTRAAWVVDTAAREVGASPSQAVLLADVAALAQRHRQVSLLQQEFGTED